LNEGDNTPIRDNMALALRLFVKDRSAGVVATGNTVVVTAGAVEVLT
jgi:hypothetical protein